MKVIARQWVQPLLNAGHLHLNTRVSTLEPDALNPHRRQIRTLGDGDNPLMHHANFDHVLLAMPVGQAKAVWLQSARANSFERHL